MFCVKCGKEIDDDATFCPFCGASTKEDAPAEVPAQEPPPAPAAEPAAEPVAAPASEPAAAPAPSEPAAAPAAPAAPGKDYNAMINEATGGFTASLKNFFSKNLLSGGLKETSDSSMHWIIEAAAYVIAMSFLFPILLQRLSVSIMGLAYSAAGARSMTFFDISNCFGSGLLIGFLTSLVTLGALFGVSFLFINVLAKKNLPINRLLNMIGYSVLPVIIGSVLGIIFGLIWAPLLVIVLFLAILVQVMITFENLKAAYDEEGRLLPFFAMTAITTVVDILLTYAWISWIWSIKP